MSEKKKVELIEPAGSATVELMASTDLLAISKAEIDRQIATAKQYPRNLATFQSSALSMVTYSRETAESMFYKLPRGGKIIEGPSVRFAEIIGQNWRNCRVAARVLGAEEKQVVSQGVFHDLETNVAISFETKRRITRKDGTRYDDDMIGTTGAAAASIAFRNAVLKGVPKMFWLPLYEKAIDAARPLPTEINDRRKAALESFAKVGVPEVAVLATLGVKTLAKIGPDELVTLRGIWNAIKEGTTTPAEAFGLGEKPIAPTLEAQLQESIEDVEERKKKVAGKNKKIAPKPSADVPKAAVPPASKIDDSFITPKQQTELYNAALQAGWRVPEEITEFIKKRFNVNSIREVRASMFAELLAKAKGNTR